MKVTSVPLAAMATAMAAVPAIAATFHCNVLVFANATFDTLPSTPAGLTPVGTYENVDYQSFDVTSAGGGTGLAAGIIPASSPNVAVHSLASQVLSGPAAFIVSGLQSIDLETLAFACTASPIGSSHGLPVTCPVTFTAYHANSTTVMGTVAQTYTPDSSVRANMQPIAFPASWRGLGRVDISVRQSVVSPIASLFIDNVVYIGHPACNPA